MRAGISMMASGSLLLSTLITTPGTAQDQNWDWVIGWQPPLISASDVSSGSWLPADRSEFLISGRVGRSASGQLQLIWPGSSIKGRFRGSSLAVQLDDGGRTDYQVLIDGDLRTSRLLDTKPGLHAYPLAQGLPSGEHRFELFRRTESFSGPTQIHGFYLADDGQILAWDQRPGLNIDFYGDSQTVGACNECGDNEQWEDLRPHNHLLSYAALLSRMLGADSQVTAVSGIGLSLGYQDVTMQQIWARTAPDPKAPLYEPAARQPDVIIVNLGQNDYSKGVGSTFIGAYDHFLRELRTRHPSAWIVCLLGAMDAAHEASPYPDFIRAAIDQQQDPKVLLHIFKVQTKQHPRVAQHLMMALELRDFLRAHVPLAPSGY